MTLIMNSKKTTVAAAQKIFSTMTLDWMIREAYKIKAVNLRNPITETSWTDVNGKSNLTIKI